MYVHIEMCADICMHTFVDICVCMHIDMGVNMYVDMWGRETGCYLRAIATSIINAATACV